MKRYFLYLKVYSKILRDTRLRYIHMLMSLFICEMFTAWIFIIKMNTDFLFVNVMYVQKIKIY